jgi:NADPH:quinone reductase-like Zn-dependent oxidoreductase
MMKAFIRRSFGSPDVLELTELATPVPAADEVLVQVHATCINPYDWHHLRGEPYVARLMAGGMGWRGPKLSILGCDMAGRVEAVGKDVTRLGPGDDVFALLPGGGFAEYVCVREDLLAAKPGNLSYEQAAAVPMAAVTALLGLRDQGRIQSGQTVLVNGASGGVGTFAVQIARALGATVTGVCSAQNMDLVRSLGADEVIDYRAQDFTRYGQRYDVLLDVAGSRPASACRRVLTRKGTLVIVGGRPGRWFQPAGHAFSALAVGQLMSQRVVMADVGGCRDKRQVLVTLSELIESGEVAPVIDRQYPFDQIPAAISYQEEGHARGKVVVTV